MAFPVLGFVLAPTREEPMKRVVLLLLAVGLATTAFLLPAQASTAKLTGTVGPGYTITLKKGTAKVKTLKAGKYTFVINDKASIHNFTVEREKGGPTIEKTLTGTSFQGKKTITMTLKKGSWKYYCSIHESQMFGFFKVTS
jgi:plastocyanin